MRTTIGTIKKIRSPKKYTDYVVFGLVSRLDSCIDNSNIVLRSISDLSLYLSPDRSEFNEIKKIIQSGATVILRNEFLDSSEYHAFMTPISKDLVIPTCCTGNLPLSELRDPTEFDGETYVVNIKYDPTEIPKEFYINLPSGYIVSSLDSEFVSTIHVYTNKLSDSVDSVNDVYEVKANGETLGDIFDSIQSHFRLIGSNDGDMEFISPFLAKNASNDRTSGIFSVYYNRPVRYLPKTIAPDSLDISYGFIDNVEFLRDYIPYGTVTFESNVVGSADNLKISYRDETLTITFGDTIEEFEVNGNRTSGNFIGDIQSKLVKVHLNGGTNLTEFEIPEFERNFKSPSDTYSAHIDVNSSIKNLISSDFEVNAIILSDSLIEYSPSDIDTEVLDRELLIMSITKGDISKLFKEFTNTIRFTGTLNGIPCYTEFLSSLYNCNFDLLLSGVPEVTESLPSSGMGIWHPEVDEFYNILDIGDTPEFNHEFNFDLSKVTVFHIFYSLAISKFILRYRYRMLFTNASIGKLRNLLNDFSARFSIINSIEIDSYESTDNNLSIELATKLNAILNYKEIIINFNLEI